MPPFPAEGSPPGAQDPASPARLAGPASPWRGRLTRVPPPARPARVPPRPVVPRLVVPAYFHPAAAPDDWAMMATQAALIRMVVLNPASGPGHHADPDYLAALRPLHEAGVQIAGYVDTNYGQRLRAAALADIERYVDWYGVTAVMFDRVSAGLGDLRHYALLARRARKAGGQVLVFNHGVHPHEGYARHADVLGTFEGPWNVYLQQAVPRWTRHWPADRFYHVVYSVPPEHLGDAFLLAGRRRAGCVYVTSLGGDNPYRELPPVPAPAARLWASP